MIHINNYISIFNWLGSIFNLDELLDLKTESLKLIKNKAKLKKEFDEREFENLYKSVDKCLQQGYKLICPTDSSYPLVLKKVFNYPVPIMYKGTFCLDKFKVSIVGSRKPQATSVTWVKHELQIALNDLKKENINLATTSGGAYGIDQWAHKASILAAVPTYCFIPTGVNHCYPRNLKPILSNITDCNGCIVSLFPPNHGVYKSNFHFRNKVMVLLSDMILIGEARRRSGTIMTANIALSCGRPVFVLPQAPIANCFGSLDLIENGAPIIKSGSDVKFQVKSLL